MLAIADLIRQLRTLRKILKRPQDDSSESEGSNNDGSDSSLSSELSEVLFRTWDLGFTAFGSTPVHFHILHTRFVSEAGGRDRWTDEQTYQELFAIAQALPGPSSTKMLYLLIYIRTGIAGAALAFFLWSFPGALGMYGLALAVGRMGETLPNPVYALLTGLNAATVGMICYAGVQLAKEAIRDRMTRLLVIMGACAGMCYISMWWFPVLMVVGGALSLLWYQFLSRLVSRCKTRLKKRRRPKDDAEIAGRKSAPIRSRSTSRDLHRRSGSTMSSRSEVFSLRDSSTRSLAEVQVQTRNRRRASWAILIAFAVGAVAIILTHQKYKQRLSRAFALFTNMFMAGTIVFGGGPVVIPLLRIYVVEPGWVSNRDFLLGLAIIAAFPGPGSNFSVYLGALAMKNTSTHSSIGALVGFIGIFLPGLVLATAVHGFWDILRTKRYIRYLLRGFHATAVGFVFTAVYRLWEIGWMVEGHAGSLAHEPWWVVIAVMSFAGRAWFLEPVVVALIVGGGLGLLWWGVKSADSVP